MNRLSIHFIEDRRLRKCAFLLEDINGFKIECFCICKTNDVITLRIVLCKRQIIIIIEFSYIQSPVFNVETSLLPVSASELMAAARRVSSNVAMFLPRHSDTVQVCRLADTTAPDASPADGQSSGRVELEQNFLERKLIAITAYFGDLVNATPSANPFGE